MKNALNRIVNKLAPKPCSIEAYHKYGIHRNYVAYICCNHFSVPADFRDCFSSYFLRRWAPSYFFSQVQEGCIFYDGIEYIVLYHKKSRGQLMQDCTRTESPQLGVTLSFRAAQSEFNLPAYVLVN